jgi:hypothetical protein
MNYDDYHWLQLLFSMAVFLSIYVTRRLPVQVLLPCMLLPLIQFQYGVFPILNVVLTVSQIYLLVSSLVSNYTYEQEIKKIAHVENKDKSYIALIVLLCVIWV